MKIKKIEFENFRNFRDHGEIKCSTDGKVTIIYGRNGDGKTTLHQLFRWVFYDKVNFNKTATTKLYNLKFERDQAYQSTFDVWGRIDFEHASEQYSITRKYTYKKDIDESRIVHRDFRLVKMDEDNNWKPIENPEKVISKLLPEGLSEYFFFDGESMIADLRVKERESASKLKKALFSMFDLDTLENAIAHIGQKELKTSVIGKLYLQKAPVTSSTAVINVKANIENAQTKLSQLDEKLSAAEQERDQKQQFVKDISEQIGSRKSKADYEKERKRLKQLRDQFLKNSNTAKGNFGDAVTDMFPKLLIAKAVEDAKSKIQLEVEKNKLPHGLTKTLIKYLTSAAATECICGNSLSEDEKEHIRNYLKLLPPKSYTSLYNEFTATAKSFGKEYNKEYIESFMMSVLDNDENAADCDMQIRELDEREKNSPDIENLIINRQKAEVDIEQLNADIENYKHEIKKLKLYLNKRMEEFDALTANTEANNLVEHKIQIMQGVLNHFTEKLDKSATTYSKELQINIQDLINQMLTSKRTVIVSPEFSVRVTDSGGDESKSEGQFAVVSFAYIGGILRMLRSQENLASKEYPLILDGPFSKLDPIQRQNVVDTLPSFAPQVILFSKDSLQDVFADENVGNVWTISSNDEKNIATVKEGYLWK